MLVVQEKKRDFKDLLEQVKTRKSFLPLDLQFFAEGGEGDTGGGAGEGSGDEGSGDEGDKSGGSGEGDKTGSKSSDSKTFTQDDVNAIAAKEAKKATEKLLKQLGVTDFKTAKEGLDKFKEITDSQKTDSQKALERAKLLEEEKGALSTQVQTLNAQLAAMKAGVNPDSLDDVIVLANNLVSDEVTIDDAIGQVIKKYPQFKVAETTTQKKEEKKPPKFTDGDHKNDGKPNEDDKWANAFNFFGQRQ